MALGKQFNQTYWENPDSGNTYAYSPLGYENGLDVPSNANFPERNLRNARIASWTNPDNKDIEGYQGLLFDPHSGTGLNEDPLVSKEDRRQAVNNVLNLGNAGEEDDDNRPLEHKSNQFYKAWQNTDFSNHTNTGTFRKVLNIINRKTNSFINPKRTKEDRQTLSDSLFYSNMPMQEIRKFENTVQAPYLRARGATSKASAGRFDPAARSISIARNQPSEELQNTLVHELGHAQDPALRGHKDSKDAHTWRGLQGADPLEEGVADGYGDAIKNSNLSDDFVPKLINDTNYTSNHPEWGTITQGALYAATRAHQATNPNQHNPVPRRSWYAKPAIDRQTSLQHSDDALLHHLVSNNPDLYDTLDKEYSKWNDFAAEGQPKYSLGDAAREASKRHLDRTYGPDPEQLKLFED